MHDASFWLLGTGVDLSLGKLGLGVSGDRQRERGNPGDIALPRFICGPNTSRGHVVGCLYLCNHAMRVM